MILREYEELDVIRKGHSEEKIVYASGTFDIMHVGHVSFFEQCRKQGDILVVGVAEDSVIREYKGPKRPVQNERQRAKMLVSLKPVNYCFINKSHNFSELDIIFSHLRPDFYVISEDARTIEVQRKYAAQNRVELVILDKLMEGDLNISTTQLIEKIKDL
ncbi:MAG: adenylyltransferase/cytidyltransferase family protein [Nanoarchaeota archaeon]